MSTSSELSEVSGHKPARSPEKTTFSQTCSLLSQYIKEKGSFKDLSLGMSCNNNTETTGCVESSSQLGTTMNLFPTMENNLGPKNLTTMDLFSPQASMNNSNATKGPKAAQLTMFYNGQVIVFNDFPADKAQELMAFANKGISESQNNNSLYTYAQSQPSFPPNSVRTSVDPIAPIVPTVNNIVPSTCNGPILEHPQVLSRPNVCDLPIMRKASLHRFLEKRKDRVASKSPYQRTNAMESINKPGENMSWLVGAKSTQI
ncbi:protein TIFY 10B-like [Vicia villosa]|uniref:protein TIFY 10B-like n=1 Tax=Vicia villosa TaxID=3911 RepID=UPI00273CD252|nr:protein TIFY 10B-like [Vicia villosa]